jgi:hypothetical protein
VNNVKSARYTNVPIRRGHHRIFAVGLSQRILTPWPDGLQLFVTGEAEAGLLGATRRGILKTINAVNGKPSSLVAISILVVRSGGVATVARPNQVTE